MSANTQEILGINTCFDMIKYNGFSNVDFRTDVSFMDYDAIVIDTSLLSYEYAKDYPDTYQGKRLISQEESHRMSEDFTKTKAQIVEFLKQGKNIFVLMAKNDNCFIYTGETQYSGTGKNARRTNVVSEFDVFSFLPIDIMPTLVNGEKYSIVCNPPYSTFFQVAKDMICYEAYFDAPKESSLLTIPNSEKAISAVFEYEKGKIIILPYIYDSACFESNKDWEKAGKKYLKALFELNSALTSHANSYTLPKWTDSIKILNEEDEESNLEKEIKKFRSIEAKIGKQKELISKIQRKKILITASGTVLEEIVKETLQEIGFVIQKVETGRSDIIASYNKTDVVAEIKGVSKSAAEKHAAQLEKWGAQFIEEKGHAPKPLLIVNGYCDTPLQERTEEVFPNQMLKYCEARGHVLITTTQLLCLYIDIKQNPACAEERIKELLSCVGKYQKYLDYKSYIRIIENGESNDG